MKNQHLDLKNLEHVFSATKGTEVWLQGLPCGNPMIHQKAFMWDGKANQHSDGQRTGTIPHPHPHRNMGEEEGILKHHGLTR